MGETDDSAAMIAQLRRRRRWAIGLLSAAVAGWLVAALILSGPSAQWEPYRVVVMSAIGVLIVCTLASFVLAVKNSYVPCPRCGKSFFASGLFVGYINPVGRKCDNCKFELKEPQKKGPGEA